MQFSQYWALNGFYNPAYAGQTERLNLYGTYSMQLMGFTNAPKSMCFGADMPFKFLNRKHGVGVGFFNEGIGLFRNQRFWAQYSFKMKLFGGNLGIGAQVGALNITFDPSNINLGEQENDPAFPTQNVNGMGLDLCAGIYYTHPLFYAGVSMMHLTSPLVHLGDNNEIQVDPSLYFVGGCNIKTRSPLIFIQPSIFLQTDMLAVKISLTGRVAYKWKEKILYGGLSYSPGTSVTVSIGGKMKDITLGYAYEIFTSKIGIGNGSHDLVVNYSLDMNFFGKSKNKHKSIRIL